MYGFWESNTGLLQQVLLTTELLFFHPLDRNFSSIHFRYAPLVSLLFSLNPCSVSRTKLSIHLTSQWPPLHASGPPPCHVTEGIDIAIRFMSPPPPQQTFPPPFLLTLLQEQCCFLPLPLSGPSLYVNPQDFTSIDFSPFMYISFLELLSVLLTCKYIPLSWPLTLSFISVSWVVC